MFPKQKKTIYQYFIQNLQLKFHNNECKRQVVGTGGGGGGTKDIKS